MTPRRKRADVSNTNINITIKRDNILQAETVT